MLYLVSTLYGYRNFVTFYGRWQTPGSRSPGGEDLGFQVRSSRALTLTGCVIWSLFLILLECWLLVVQVDNDIFIPEVSFSVNLRFSIQ
jgi:hypothetical protein